MPGPQKKRWSSQTDSVCICWYTQWLKILAVRLSLWGQAESVFDWCLPRRFSCWCQTAPWWSQKAVSFRNWSQRQKKSDNKAVQEKRNNIRAFKTVARGWFVTKTTWSENYQRSVWTQLETYRMNHEPSRDKTIRLDKGRKTRLCGHANSPSGVCKVVFKKYSNDT